MRPSPVLRFRAMRAGQRALRGIAAMIASQFAFILNDTLVKLASAKLPMGEIIFLRGVFASLLIGALAVAMGLHRDLARLARPMVAWRTAGELGGTFFYLLALFQMPIANVTIIFQAVPLTATAGAALLLGEAVGWRRWTAIGFLGVLLVVRPGLSGFDAYGLFVLVSVLFVSVRDLSTRTMPSAVPTILLTLVTAVAVTAMGGAIGLTEAWLVPDRTTLLQLGGAAVLLAIGYFMVIAAMRLGEMSVTAPFRYVVVAFAVAIGFVVWGDVPDGLMLLGAAIIVSTGLYTFYREAKVRGRRAPAPVATPAPPPS
jgi:drug/metabolite transporter (DMT)-like permease